MLIFVRYVAQTIFCSSSFPKCVVNIICHITRCRPSHSFFDMFYDVKSSINPRIFFLIETQNKGNTKETKKYNTRWKRWKGEEEGIVLLLLLTIPKQTKSLIKFIKKKEYGEEKVKDAIEEKWKAKRGRGGKMAPLKQQLLRYEASRRPSAPLGRRGRGCVGGAPTANQALGMTPVCPRGAAPRQAPDQPTRLHRYARWKERKINLFLDPSRSFQNGNSPES
ncbi:unnamed protein product [Arctogadus glacialis]